MRKISLFRCLSLVALIIGACAPAAQRPPEEGRVGQPSPAAAQRTLVVALRGEPPTLATKELVGFSGALRDLQQVFNADLDGRDERGQSFPYLAADLPKIDTDSWRVFPDGRMETTYRLKPNLTWHDGAPLTSDDFVFSWRVYATPTLGASSSSPMRSIQEVVALDPQSFLIRWRELSSDAAELGTHATTSLLPPLPEHILRQDFEHLNPTDFPNLPFWSHEYVGLGPYRLTRWEPGAFVEAEAFDGHVLGRPKIDRLRAVFVPDPNTALANLLAGEAHYVGQYLLASDHGENLEQQWSTTRGGTVLYAAAGFRRGVVQLRPELVQAKGLLDVRVRRALAHALNKTEAGDALQAGKGVLADAFVSSRLPYYQEVERVISKYPYDPAGSLRLMDEAGFTKGADGLFVGKDGSPLEVEVASSSGTKNEQENTVIVDGLKAVGFNAKSNILPAAQSREAENYTQRPGVLVWGGGGDLASLQSFTSEQVPGPATRWKGDNYGAWNNPEYDQLFGAFSQSLRAADRVHYIAEMNRVLTQQLPWIPYWYQPLVTAHVAGLKGPIAREVPDAPNGMLRIYDWNWQ